MRETSFRVWDRVTCKMYYGLWFDFSVDSRGESVVNFSKSGPGGGRTGHCIFRGGTMCSGPFDPIEFEIMQMSGILDKYGDDIYENDLIRADLDTDRMGLVRFVIFKDGCFVCITPDLNEDSAYPLSNYTNIDNKGYIEVEYLHGGIVKDEKKEAMKVLSDRRKTSGSHFSTAIKSLEILEKIVDCCQGQNGGGESVCFSTDWGDNSLTVSINGSHTHVGNPLGTFENLINDLHNLLVHNTGLGMVKDEKSD